MPQRAGPRRVETCPRPPSRHIPPGTVHVQQSGPRGGEPRSRLHPASRDGRFANIYRTIIQSALPRRHLGLYWRRLHVYRTAPLSDSAGIYVATSGRRYDALSEAGLIARRRTDGVGDRLPTQVLYASHSLLPALPSPPPMSPPPPPHSRSSANTQPSMVTVFAVGGAAVTSTIRIGTGDHCPPPPELATGETANCWWSAGWAF